MKYILYIDDDPKKRETISTQIEKNLGSDKWSVRRPMGRITNDLIFETEQLLKNDSIIYELMILDIEYDRDTAGGLKLYHKLEHQYSKRWKNILIFSRIERSGLEADNDKILAFLTSKGLSSENYVSSTELLFARV